MEQNYVTVTLCISIDSWYAAAAIVRHRLPTGRSAANQPHAAAVIDRLDTETDRRTDTRPLRKPCSAYYANSVNKLSCITN